MIHSLTSRSSNSLPRSVPSGRAVGEAEAPGWLTFRQAPSLGDNVRKGQRGAIVVYADRFVPEDEKQPAAETSEDPQSGPRFTRARRLAAGRAGAQFPLPNRQAGRTLKSS